MDRERLQIRRWKKKLPLLAVAASLMIGPAGCAELPSFRKSVLPLFGLGEKAEAKTAKKAEKPELPPSGPTRVEVDSTALALNQPERDVALRREFLNRLKTMLGEERYLAAKLWVQRHPDLTFDILRDCEEVNDNTLITLAQFHDEQLAVSEEGSWRLLLTQFRDQPKQSAAYREQRATFMHNLRNGKFAEAAKIDLVKTANAAGSRLLVIDAYYQVGISQMLTEQPAAAAQSFGQAVQYAQGAAPMHLVYSGLLLAESQRRAGDSAAANRTWAETAHAGANLLSLHHPVPDPTFWDRASYLQPVGIDWPEAVEFRIRELAKRGAGAARTSDIQRVAQASPPGHASTPTLLWTCIGSWLMERGEPQGGLVALKRAETSATPEVSNWVRIAQARCLMRLEQGGAASALLVQVIGNQRETPHAKAAMADLGTIRVRAGAAPQGLTLLKQALDGEARSDWAGRATSEADLGLALLMSGDEANGLKWLEIAQRQFRTDGDQESLARSLWNQARYFEHAKNPTLAKQADREIKALQL